MSAISEFIKENRKKAGLTQEEFDLFVTDGVIRGVVKDTEKIKENA